MSAAWWKVGHPTRGSPPTGSALFVRTPRRRGAAHAADQAGDDDDRHDVGHGEEQLRREADTEDRELLHAADGAQHGWRDPLDRVADGVEALAFLADPNNARPGLLLLDLNMPRMDGREVLGQIVNDPDLREIPVVVPTTSDAAPDVSAAYRLRCSSYIVKPVDFDQFVKVVQGITDYWFTLAVLPSSGSRD